MTANVITYRGRSAMREMGKVLDLPEDILGRFSDLFGRGDFRDTPSNSQSTSSSPACPPTTRASRPCVHLYQTRSTACPATSANTPAA